MASVNPYPPNDNKNYAYNQSIRSDDEETLSEHFASFAQAELLAMPLGGNGDSQPVDHIARTIINSPVGSHLEEARFFMSSIIASHISPKLSDFKTLTSILSYPVKELGGVYAVGQGTIEFHTDITTGRKLTLQRVLFVPFARDRLISVTSLCQDGMNCAFDSGTCWVTDKDDTTVARGAVSRGLFFLSVKVPFVAHFELAPLQQERTHSVDMLATRTPNIETWHRRLGHCSTQTVIDMARNCTVDGITIDVSVAPPKCVNCVLGKQACLPGPIQWEGIQAKRPLEQVYIELWGPMSVVSQSGYLYTAFIVDDFSSYMWSLPLRSKDEAAAALTPWKRTVENLSGHRLKTLVTKDSGPISGSMPDWCTLHWHGIEHQVTASPQNGRIEFLRHMIIGKTRSTRLACNAPLSLWDEFLATTTYLTTLTVSIKYGGKTPYELWKGHPPTLSHLREIGCFAFALIATQDPKVYQYSEPCILAGYLFRIKEYRLWNPASGIMFNSSRLPTSYLLNIWTLSLPTSSLVHPLASRPVLPFHHGTLQYLHLYSPPPWRNKLLWKCKPIELSSNCLSFLYSRSQ